MSYDECNKTSSTHDESVKSWPLDRAAAAAAAACVDRERERDHNNNQENELNFNERTNLNELIRKELNSTSTRTNNVAAAAAAVAASAAETHSYRNVYAESFSLDLNSRENVFFIDDEPVQIQIVGCEEEPSLVVLHTNVYTIRIKHAKYTWLIKRKYKNFLKLYETYALFKTKMNLKNASSHLTTHHASLVINQTSNLNSTAHYREQESNFRPSDHFKLIFQTIASDFSQAKNILEKFLQDVVDHKIFRNHNETLKFLEVSHLSFVDDLGDKNKEGIVKKRSLYVGCCFSFNISFFWQTRWLILKDTWIGYLNPQTGLLKVVLLVDQAFRVSNGLENTGTRNGLQIDNLSRNLLVKCYNERRAHEWRLSILQMLYTTGQKFLVKQPFDSFAPVRENSLTKWFVDGSDYMESIADAIDAAKEEIFITGFFLSPEIYLKRPMISGDMWRLDKLLKRKAEQGVKIYVLIYKEIELTLPINSAYSKRVLSHRNIKVLRHPDHINEPNQLLAIMWAHHEKLVIVDQSVAFFGGIDLCYGRWDNHSHKLTDLGSVLPPNNPPTPQKLCKSRTIGSMEHIDDVRLDEKSTSSVRLVGFKKRINSLDSTENVQNLDSSSFLLRDHHQTNANVSRFQPSNYNTITSESKKNCSSNASHMTSRLNFVPSEAVLAQNEPIVAPPPPGKSDKKLRPFSRNLKASRMFSSPSCFIDNDEKIMLDRTFDTLSDEDDQHNDDEEGDEAVELKPKRFGLDIFRQSLKRSQSLDTDLISKQELLNELEFPSLGASNNESINRLKQLKNTLNTKLKTKLNREYGELSILNKLRKIKQFKDNLKRYKIRINFRDNESELNSSVDKADLDEPSIELSAASYLQGSCKYWIGKDYCNFIHKDVTEVDSPFKDSIDRTKVPRLPWHDVAGCVCGPAARDIARHFIQRWNYTKTKKVRKNKNYPLLVPKSYSGQYVIPAPIVAKCSECKVQVVRSVSTWSAGIAKTESSIHEAMKHLIRTSTNYVYIENQFFVSLMDDSTVVNEIAQCLYERIVRAHNEKQSFKVFLVVPLIPGYEGQYGRSSGVLLHAITHYNNSSINGLIKKLTDSSIDALNYICFFSLRTWSELNGRLITELIYVHSKLMIVDDRACIIGSANINDRSLLGHRDSEVALVIEDQQFVNGVLNKKPCQVGKFCSSLRQRLFREFLGELPSCLSSAGSLSSFSSISPNSSFMAHNKSRKTALHDSQLLNNNSNLYNSQHSQSHRLDVSDPCSDDFYKKVLLKYASQNTKIYDLVFNVIPSNYVNNFQQLKEHHKTISLSHKDPQEARQELNKIRGYIVLYPNRFLSNEHLKPPLGTKEKLMPDILWT